MTQDKGKKYKEVSKNNVILRLEMFDNGLFYFTYMGKEIEYATLVPINDGVKNYLLTVNKTLDNK